MSLKTKLYVYVIIAFIALGNNVFSADLRLDPIVQTDQGLVRGRLAREGDYAYFLGIPYAQVDLNSPFGPSTSHPGFGDDIFDASDGSIVCPQKIPSNMGCSCNFRLTPDCLRLNIYVPKEASSFNPLSVLVWIHGGQFTNGAGAWNDPEYFMDKSIIVVTINYRLGPYGFMCLDAPLVPGNQGLKDQHEALLWVKNNIAAFGGNPQEVTIAGQDAGSISTLLHLYSPKDKLFQRIIAQSGTPFDNFSVKDLDVAIKLVIQLGFNTTDTEAALNFLIKTSSDQVVDAYYDLSLVLQPCKEMSYSGVENFIYTYPFDLSNENKVRDTFILIGHTAQEINDLQPFDDDLQSDPFYDKLKENFDINEEQVMETAGIIRHFYIGDEPISTKLKSKLTDFESDFSYNHPVQSMINRLLNENANPLYQYVFSFMDDSNTTEAKHSDDLSYLFKTDTERNEEQELMVQRMTTLWANFVKYGNPTPTVTDLLPEPWEPATTETRPYMELSKELHMKSRIYRERLAFWELFYSIYEKHHRLARDCYVN